MRIKSGQSASRLTHDPGMAGPYREARGRQNGTYDPAGEYFGTPARMSARAGPGTARLESADGTHYLAPSPRKDSDARNLLFHASSSPACIAVGPRAPVTGWHAADWVSTHRRLGIEMFINTPTKMHRLHVDAAAAIGALMRALEAWTSA